MKKIVDAHHPFRFRKRPAPRGAGLAFVEHALTLETDDCILFPHGLNADGYARLNLKGENGKRRHVYGHVHVCERAHGDRPSLDMVAAHSCRTPACVNKRHLRWATRAENTADMIAHGTAPRGRKLKPVGVELIRDGGLADVMRYRDIGRMHDCSGSTVRNVVRGETWKDLPVAIGPGKKRAA